MIRGLALVALLGAPFTLAERWTEYRSGPFRVVSNAGDKVARERLTEMEQIRFALQSLIGKDGGRTELKSVWPITLVLFDNAKEYGAYALGRPFVEGGAAVLSAWNAEVAQPLAQTSAWRREFAQRLIEDNAGRMPQEIEEGLSSLLSTLEVRATRLSLGTAPPEELRTKGWARIHYLATTAELAGRLRIYLNNLQQGGDETLALRNSFNLSREELEKRVAEHQRAAQFESVPIPGRALNPNRDFVERPVAESALQALFAELKRAGKTFDPESPRGLVAKNTKASLELAAAANPAWGEPHFRLAALETNPLAKIKELRLATTLAPRATSYWQALAEAQTAAEQHADATRSWAAAERSAASDAERERLRATRRNAEDKRTEFELADRRRQADERAQELERLKQAAAAEVHAAEDAANLAQGGLKSGAQPVQWWTAEKGIPVTGALAKVDCLATSLRLTVTRPAGAILLLVRDPKNIGVRGAEQAVFACGSPRPAPKIVLEHNGKPDPAFGTAGDVMIVEFP